MASQQQARKISDQISEQEKKELDRRAAEGKTVVPGGTRGKTLEAQERLAEGRSKGGQTRKEQLGAEGYQEMGKRVASARKTSLVVNVRRRKEFRSTNPNTARRADDRR